jgi:hypothetical protein
MATEMTVDQLLEQQQEDKPLTTLEPVDGKPEFVRVTPWLRATGCLCTLALVIPKSLIAAVKLTRMRYFLWATASKYALWF